MAHKKAGGSSRNGRDSAGRRLGVKKFGGEKSSAATLSSVSAAPRFIRVQALALARITPCLRSSQAACDSTLANSAANMCRSICRRWPQNNKRTIDDGLSSRMTRKSRQVVSTFEQGDGSTRLPFFLPLSPCSTAPFGACVTRLSLCHAKGRPQEPERKDVRKNRKIIAAAKLARRCTRPASGDCRRRHRPQPRARALALHARRSRSASRRSNMARPFPHSCSCCAPTAHRV